MIVTSHGRREKAVMTSLPFSDWKKLRAEAERRNNKGRGRVGVADVARGLLRDAIRGLPDARRTSP